MSSEKIFLGVERYAKIILSRSKEKLSIKYFEDPRFFEVRDSDTHYKSLSEFPRFKPFFPNARKRLKSSVYVGDKIPRLYLQFAKIADEFPGAKVLFLLRNPFDICLSYQRRLNCQEDSWSRDIVDAVTDWNESLNSLDRAINLDLNIKLIEYESMFAYGSDILAGAEDIFRWLNLKIDNDVVDFCKSITSKVAQMENRRQADSLTSDQKRFISLNSDFERYQKWIHNT